MARVKRLCAVPWLVIAEGADSASLRREERLRADVTSGIPENPPHTRGKRPSSVSAALPGVAPLLDSLRPTCGRPHPVHLGDARQHLSSGLHHKRSRGSNRPPGLDETAFWVCLPSREPSPYKGASSSGADRVEPGG